MKRIFLLAAVFLVTLAGACQKTKSSNANNQYGNGPRTTVPAELQGNWMYGYFSMTEYWSQNPADYLGNALQFAIAFKFNADGTYDQYFTSSSVTSGITTYQQSVSKGTMEVNTVSKTIITYTNLAHYKRTRNGQVIEERDLAKTELSGPATYTYTIGTEPNGTKAIYLKLGSSNPLTFLQKL